MDLNQYLRDVPPHLAILRFLFKDVPLRSILDIGCCEGEDSLRYLREFPLAVVHAFEPYPKNISRIKKLIGSDYHPRFKLIEAAVSDANGMATLSISSGQPPEASESTGWDYGNKSSSLLPPAALMFRHHPWLKFSRNLQVQTITLDYFALAYRIDNIDFMHIDIQGAELRAFSSAKSLLRRTGVIWVEVSDHQIYKDQPNSEAISEFLSSLGFVLILKSVSEGFGDHLYVNPGYFHVSRHDLVGDPLLKELGE
ncbi:FkbM family methyltransferase [Synechococcus sp. CS-1332]|uniref:FkbM family methyltransferase n=1 Tax=Synechococcus sp. CS-1332 TaxID=2847972 RepID=UPI00223B8AFA|nr:FkbM family methyltransferase [Synechococcus sp. CS-1332]MCT0209042.1 FkbM family methyltransferase [Synechococcus sp. CS-1332]